VEEAKVLDAMLMDLAVLLEDSGAIQDEWERKKKEPQRMISDAIDEGDAVSPSLPELMLGRWTPEIGKKFMSLPSASSNAIGTALPKA